MLHRLILSDVENSTWRELKRVSPKLNHILHSAQPSHSEWSRLFDAYVKTNYLTVTDLAVVDDSPRTFWCR
jgi:hypothetical protein